MGLTWQRSWVKFLFGRPEFIGSFLTSLPVQSFFFKQIQIYSKLLKNWTENDSKLLKIFAGWGGLKMNRKLKYFQEKDSKWLKIFAGWGRFAAYVGHNPAGGLACFSRFTIITTIIIIMIVIMIVNMIINMVNTLKVLAGLGTAANLLVMVVILGHRRVRRWWWWW